MFNVIKHNSLTVASYKCHVAHHAMYVGMHVGNVNISANLPVKMNCDESILKNSYRKHAKMFCMGCYGLDSVKMFYGPKGNR